MLLIEGSRRILSRRQYAANKQCALNNKVRLITDSTVKSNISYFATQLSVRYMYFQKNESQRNYCNCSLQTGSPGSWILAYLSQVYFIFDFPSGPLP